MYLYAPCECIDMPRQGGKEAGKGKRDTHTLVCGQSKANERKESCVVAGGGVDKDGRVYRWSHISMRRFRF